MQTQENTPQVERCPAGPLLSVVIPAYNEARRLPGTLEKLFAYLSGQPYAWEIIVVANACTDGTEDVVSRAAERMPRLRLLTVTKRGKGRAARVGALASRGEIVFLCDADLSMPAPMIDAFLRTAQTADVVIGSREVLGARRFDEPPRRHAMGRVFNRLVQMLIVPGVEDTQCGFKAFRRSAALQLFGLQHLNGFAFDVELIYLARKAGYAMTELGIDWHFDRDSRVRPGVDSVAMTLEVLRIPLFDALGRYRMRRAPVESAADSRRPAA